MNTNERPLILLTQELCDNIAKKYRTITGNDCTIKRLPDGVEILPEVNADEIKSFFIEYLRGFFR